MSEYQTSFWQESDIICYSGLLSKKGVVKHLTRNYRNNVDYDTVYVLTNIRHRVNEALGGSFITKRITLNISKSL